MPENFSTISKRVVGVIPVRLESTRLARKPLLDLCGYPIMAWVYARARAASGLAHLLIATDSDEIMEWCRSLSIPAMMTSPAHRSGTDRIHEVMRMHERLGERGDIYINIQGDEPAVDPEHIRLLLAPFARDGATEVTTLMIALPAPEASDPNRVKVVTDGSGRALYFSRCPIPYHRDAAGEAAHYKHLGLYAYSARALDRFHSLRPGRLERIEKLEQLRFLENGIAIHVEETDRDTIGIDTAEDLAAARDYFASRAIPFPAFAP